MFLGWAHVDPHSGAPLPSSLLTRSSYGIIAAKSPWLDIHLNSRSLCSSHGVSEVPPATCSKRVQTFTGLYVSPPENGTVFLPDMQSRKWRQSPKTPYCPPGIVNLSPGLKNLHSQTNTKYIHFLPLYHHLSCLSYKCYILAPLKGPRSAQIHPPSQICCWHSLVSGPHLPKAPELLPMVLQVEILHLTSKPCNDLVWFTPFLPPTHPPFPFSTPLLFPAWFILLAAIHLSHHSSRFVIDIPPSALSGSHSTLQHLSHETDHSGATFDLLIPVCPASNPDSGT